MSAQVKAEHRLIAEEAVDTGCVGYFTEIRAGMVARLVEAVAKRLADLEATVEARVRQELAGWEPTSERPIAPGETRLMAVEILRNGVPDWDVFVATVSEEYEDEWSSESDDPGWPPSDVGYSMSIAGLPRLGAKEEVSDG